MTTAESRALYRLASFLLGPCDQERRHLHSSGGAQDVSHKEALESLEFLFSRKAEVGGVYSHGTAELRDKWQARFGQVEAEEVAP